MLKITINGENNYRKKPLLMGAVINNVQALFMKTEKTFLNKRLLR